MTIIVLSRHTNRDGSIAREEAVVCDDWRLATRTIQRMQPSPIGAVDVAIDTRQIRRVLKFINGKEATP